MSDMTDSSRTAPPNPTYIYRLAHVDNLPTLLRRGALHAANHTPPDDLPYRTIHNVSIQVARHTRPVPCGPQGTMHDYVPFYFGYLSPMLFQLKTGRVTGYNEGQRPLIYLVTTVQTVHEANLPFVFSDGHGIAAYTKWFDDLTHLDRVDWSMVYQRYWSDHPDDMDRQRRKQAEFLVYRSLPWALIRGVGVFDDVAGQCVEQTLEQFEPDLHKPVRVVQKWYY